MGSDSKKSSGNVQTAGGGGAGGGGSQIPAAAKKIVQNLKEIVGKNCTDAEIYAVLLDCNMDPDDAVHRLLSQDTFHEVKSKRERRKEVKETQDSRTRNNNGASNRVVRLGSEHVAGRTGSAENNYNELGKAFLKRENGSVAPSVSSSSSYTYRATGKILNEKPLPHSDSSYADNRRQSIGAGNIIISSVQPSSELQSSWSGVSKGHVSMADIVKMGRPLTRGSQMSSEILYAHQHATSSNLSHYRMKSSQISSTPDSELHQDFYSPHPSDVSETIHESGMTAGQHGFDNKWPAIEHLTAASGSSLFDTSAVSDGEVYSNQSSLCSDRANLYRNSPSEELQVSERDADNQNQNSNCNRSDSAASGQIFVNGAGGVPNNDSMKETSSYVSHRQMHKHNEGISSSLDLPFQSHSASLSDDLLSGVSSAAEILQQLNIGKEETAKPLTEDNSGVVLPNYLQDFAADCSHLSFGTYKSGVASAPTVPTSSNPSKSDLEVSVGVDGSSPLHWNIRNSGYQDDEQLGFMHDTHRAAADSRKYESQVPSQPELMKQDIPETTHGDQYGAPSSVVSDSSNKNAQQSDSNMTFVIDPNGRNLPPPSEMLSYSKPVPSDLLASTVQSLRARDSSPFLAAQSIPLRYSAALSSINSQSISMSEVLNSSTYSLPPPASQVLPGSNLPKGNILSQHLSVHPYSQPELSLGNITGYSSRPQNQTYVPSALPQAFPDGSALHDSLSGMNYDLSQYRSGAAMNNMHLPTGSNVGYGSYLGNSTNLPGNFLHNLATSHAGAGAGYDDLLRSQFKDGNVIPHQQNNGFSAWDFGNGSRTMSVLPESAYYSSLLGRNSQHAVYQQGQQVSEHYDSLVGYPKIYRSRTRIGREQQRQNLGDFTLTDSQGTTSNQLNQIWGHKY